LDLEEDINDCRSKKIIAWMWKPQYRNEFLLVNPQYINSGDVGWLSIPEDIFPTEGSMMIYPQNGYDAEDIMTRYGGHLVLITMNDPPQCNQKERNWYSAKCNPDMSAGFSQIEIERFSAKGLMQIIKTHGIQIEKALEKVLLADKFCHLIIDERRYHEKDYLLNSIIIYVSFFNSLR
jgi:hypothetical protein